MSAVLCVYIWMCECVCKQGDNGIMQHCLCHTDFERVLFCLKCSTHSLIHTHLHTHTHTHTHTHAHTNAL